MDADRADIQPILAFEGPASFGPAAWGGDPADTVSLDESVSHEGDASGHIARDAASHGDVSALSLAIPLDFAGDEIELSGWIRLQSVVGRAGLWLREDGRGQTLELQDTDAGIGGGTHDWARYRVSLPLDPDARSIHFGALLRGTGDVWLDDVEVRVDGRPLHALAVADLPPVPPDFELPAPTDLQLADLVLLAKVWGFVKYHHPAVTRGDVDWDRALLGVLPAVCSAADRDAALAVLDSWVAQLGEPPPRHTRDPVDPAIPAPVDWLAEEALLGPALSARLIQIYDRRDTRVPERYVGRGEAGQADFSAESASPFGFPATDRRLLAAFRLWNLVGWWFPYRDLRDEQPDATLARLLPVFLAAKDARDYERALLLLIGSIGDAHAQLRATRAQPPDGNALVPVQLRFVDGLPVAIGAGGGLVPGDTLLAVDGRPTSDMVREWLPYYPG
jgi:hypothetical protein